MARPLPAGVVKAPPAEYERPLEGLAVRRSAYPDTYAPRAGHAGGWPVGYDPARGSAWLAHCYGMVGVGRDLAPDTGTGGELYAVIGQAPRQLDRNIALVGRVIDGHRDADRAAARHRRRSASTKEAAQRRSPITRIVLAADMPEAERPRYRGDADRQRQPSRAT